MTPRLIKHKPTTTLWWAVSFQKSCLSTAKNYGLSGYSSGWNAEHRSETYRRFVPALGGGAKLRIYFEVEVEGRAPPET